MTSTSTGWAATTFCRPISTRSRFGNSGLLFTYTPFAALVFALFGLNLGIWSLQCVWAVTNIVALAALIYLSIRIVVPRLQRKQVVRWALLLLLPALR